MPSLPFPLPALIKDEQLNITSILHIASFLFFSDIWVCRFHPAPLLKWDFTTGNIPNLFCHFVFLALLYGILFRLVKPILIWGLGLIMSHLVQDRGNRRDGVSEEWYSRYAAETNNSTAYRVMEEHRLSRKRAFWTMVLISLSLLLFSLDAASCRSTQGTIAHLILPPGLSPWIPAWGFLAYLGLILLWSLDVWESEQSYIPATAAFREYIKKREDPEFREQEVAIEIVADFATGGGPMNRPG